jgi:hypothetical protein
MTSLWVAFLLQLGRGIVVETDSPDAHCPDLHQTREAVSARLGAIEGSGWRARYTIVHDQGEIPRDFVLLELTSPEGETRLRRELPIGESCTAVADAIALVLDQHFRALLAPEEAEPVESGTPRRDEATHRAPAGGETETPASWLAMLEMAAVSFPPSVAPGLRLQALFGPSWHAGLGLAMPLGDRVETLEAGGEARARSLELGAHLGFGPALGVVRPYFGPTLFAMLERGHTTSPLMSSAEYRLLAGAGAELGVNVRVGERWRAIAFGSGAGIFAQSAPFMVGGEEVLHGKGWMGKAGLGFAYAF